MKILIATRRFVHTPDGCLWSANPVLAYSFWTRYLDVFDRVELLARARYVESAPEGWHRATGDNVSGIVVPDFHTPLQLMLTLRQSIHRIKRAISSAEAILLRTGSDPFAPLVAKMIPRGRPYGVEVLGNPDADFSPGSYTGIMRRFYRSLLSRELRRQCSRAATAAYVTSQALQIHYPAGRAAFSTYYSSIDLPDSAFVTGPRRYDRVPDPVKIVMVGSLERIYKAPDILLKATANCIRKGIKINVSIIGEGKHLEMLKRQAEELRISQHVIFHGYLGSLDQVIGMLDVSSVFILPSRAEGLPRAMIEAMARALPCIGSTVGGIPELLHQDDLVPPGEVDALTDKIIEVVNNPARMTAMSQRNLEKAKEYRSDTLRERRIKMYRALERATLEYVSPS